MHAAVHVQQSATRQHLTMMNKPSMPAKHGLLRAHVGLKYQKQIL
jgi:hypothetical protein